MSSCIWKDIITSCVFRNPLRIRFPHKTDCLAQIIQPYCRVWKTYNGMEICDYALCRATVGMAFAVFSFDNICVFHAAFVQPAESPYQISANAIKERCGHHRVDQTVLILNFMLPRVVNPCPFSTFIMKSIMKGLATTPSSFSQKGVLRCEQIRMRKKAPALYKRLWKRGSYWKGVL